MAPFHFEVRYRPGAANRNADALSRQPIHDSIFSVTPGIQVPNMIQEQMYGPQIPPQDLVTGLAIHLQALQEAHQVISVLKFYWQCARPPSKQELRGQNDVHKLVQWDKICIKDGVLYCRFRPPSLSAPPP